MRLCVPACVSWIGYDHNFAGQRVLKRCHWNDFDDSNDLNDRVFEAGEIENFLTVRCKNG